MWSICKLKKKFKKLTHLRKLWEIMKKHLRRCALRLAKPWLTAFPLLKPTIFLDWHDMEIDSLSYNFSQNDLLELNINDENEEDFKNEDDFDTDDEEDDYDPYDDEYNYYV